MDAGQNPQVFSPGQSMGSGSGMPLARCLWSVVPSGREKKSCAIFLLLSLSSVDLAWQNQQNPQGTWRVRPLQELLCECSRSQNLVFAQTRTPGQMQCALEMRDGRPKVTPSTEALQMLPCVMEPVLVLEIKRSQRKEAVRKRAGLEFYRARCESWCTICDQSSLGQVTFLLPCHFHLWTWKIDRVVFSSHGCEDDN